MEKLKKKYDWVIILEYSLIVAICGFMIIYPLVAKKEAHVIDYIFTTLAIFVLTYFMINFFSIKYDMDDKHLYVKSGMNKVQLEFKKIVEIKHKRRFFCSSITAVHCLEIVYSPFGSSADLRYFYVSVKDEEELIKKIEEKSKKLKIK